MRASGFDQSTQRLVTLDVSGTIVFWDPQGNAGMRLARRFQLDPENRQECTCVSLDHHMIAVGAREFVTFYDARRRDSVASVPIAKVGYANAFPQHSSLAARSLAVRGCLVSVGLSSAGGVIFLDKRKMTTCLHEAGWPESAAARSKYTAAMSACMTNREDSEAPRSVQADLEHTVYQAGAGMRCAAVCAHGAQRMLVVQLCNGVFV